MKKLMRRMREEKGFTLAELLIVVAIIAVLVAIAIPIFTTQLEKSREATDLANVRAAYATLVTDYLSSTGTFSAKSINVSVNQRTANWQTLNSSPANYPLEQMKDGAMTTITVPSHTSGTYKVAISAGGTVTVN